MLLNVDEDKDDGRCSWGREGRLVEYNQSLRRGLFHYARRPTFTYYILDYVERNLFQTQAVEVVVEYEYEYIFP